MHFLCKCNRNPPFMPFYPFARQNTRRSHTAGEQALSAKGGRLRRAFRLSFGRDFLGYFSVFCRLRQGWRVRGALRSAGGWRLRGGAGLCLRAARKPLPPLYATRVLAAARWGGALLVSGPGSRFLRAAPRGVLRWRGARGALRPLFLLRSCAADQEKRPEKKSWAVMACVSLRLERPGSTCIRSAPRCISRG